MECSQARTAQERGEVMSRAAWAVAVAALVALADPGAARRSVTVLPEDARPGFTVRRLRPALSHLSYSLVSTPVAQYFAVLEDGIVMTTADLAPLLNLPVNLGVLEETPNTTSTHSLHMYVLERRDMLRFSDSVIEGAKIKENAPPGTRVSLPPIKLEGKGTGGPIKYTIISGDHGAFEILKNETLGLVTTRPLDREHRPSYRLGLQASDARGIDRANVKLFVEVEDVNDNSPQFDDKVYRFSLGKINGTEWQRFAKLGKVHATDADGDKVAYRLATHTSMAIIVPQTGEILLTGDPALNTEYQLTVIAHDLRVPSRESKPSRVFLEFNEEEENSIHRIEKRRVTRAVRPTKRIEFTESDGEQEGKIVFQLEKETERETFKIRDENPWVAVEPNGAVRVKKKWDYEELGPEKTIDFWVTITNAGVGGGLEQDVPFSGSRRMECGYETDTTRLNDSS
ncbi:unnamed protein product [Nezara viridula]|uniref:Cadherin domain-containing protein n=1 Tax=Nezara viridula TaxID=85310 RepID=A0A9P0DW04_NEZVI|nr:unnamed protein product [Nezara viridula]